jgi:pentatricopeptide repeat protein
MYINGYGVEKNLQKAEKWFHKAVEQGLEEAKKALQDMNYHSRSWWNATKSLERNMDANSYLDQMERKRKQEEERRQYERDRSEIQRQRK